MRVHTNVSSLQAQRAVSEHTKEIESTSGKLSSGLRVRSAADDAASFAIGAQLNSKIRTLNQSKRNANDAVSELQIVEASMNKMSELLVRLREISIAAANDTVDESQRTMMNYEYMQMRHELERVSQGMSINQNTLVKVGEITGARTFNIGGHDEPESKVKLDTEMMTLNEYKLNLVDSHVKTKYDAQINLQYIDKAITRLSSSRAYVGSIMQRMDRASTSLTDMATDSSTARSRMLDADFAHEASVRTKSQLLLNGATGVLSQANNLGANALKLLKDS
jgi:flagellin